MRLAQGEGRAGMLGRRRAVRTRVARLMQARPGALARLRLFGLLVLLVALFGGLQALVDEGVPRVEIRFVPREVPIQVPVEVPVDRVVERIVYVPVPVEGASPVVPAEGARPPGAPSSGVQVPGAQAPAASPSP